MNDDEAAAASEEGVEVGPVGGVGDVAGLLRMEHEHVGRLELSTRRKRFGADGAGAALVEKWHPLFQEPGIVVRARPV